MRALRIIPMSVSDVMGSKKSIGRKSAKAAGYMELTGAVKDADCRKVKVSGGVSESLGCCNYYEPESKDTKEFRCGVCEYHTAKGK